ncbi:SGNH/GDSL hydrolase family protein [Actinomarinicola tropica]|uniref:DUF459 domain-containing protein n=1 Tax=Actinomarinicola tropica TaxID=2789776 RepID=A0A5Q2RSD3_9ACTN|nr:DUF459 domain-containing protein [Actinomarinicola tropica]QGG96115.1 DUF459 domain-containing protein [Actinomarinicola tropica]
MSGEERSGDEGGHRGATVPAGRVLAVILVGFVLAALVNADSLVEQAERKPFGWPRDVSLAVWEPVQDLSELTRINVVRDAVDSALGRGDGDADEDFEFPPPDVEVASPSSTTTTPSGDPDGEAPATTTTTAPPEPELRTPTAEEPLRVWVGGDSMSQVFGQSLVAMTDATGVMESTLDYRISTGLTRPDYFNWPAHLDAEMERLDPEAVVIMFGANDAQGMEVDGQVYERLSPPWQEEYRRRVAGTMDLLRSEGRVVYWVGQPIMRDPGFSDRMAQLNEIFRSEAELRPWVRFVDSYDLFANDGGAYEAFLPGVDGTVQDLRQGDGIHLSRAGGDLLARTVLDVVEADADLD